MLTPRNEAIRLLNEKGKRGQPVFFFTDFTGTQAYITDPENSDDVLWQIQRQRNYSFKQAEKKDFTFQKTPESLDSFRQKFDSVIRRIQYGDSFLVNLTLKTPIQTNLSLDDIFQLSHAKYKILYKNRFVVFSPETFIEIRDNKIYSHPMKGTIDDSISEADKIILNDKKETAEHVTIVDLIRNDISQFANKVKVNRFRYIDEIKTHEKTLLQVSSEIEGTLDDDWNTKLGSLIFSLLPAGSISGAPKPSTLDIIKNAEDYERGFYTGICGYFDGKNLDTGVMIRFIEKENEQLYFKSGGGITSFSNLESEYREVIDKIYVPFY